MTRDAWESLVNRSGPGYRTAHALAAVIATITVDLLPAGASAGTAASEATVTVAKQGSTERAGGGPTGPLPTPSMFWQSHQSPIQ